jgi:AraC family ethanolamine operon transcriptional activator
MSPHRYIQLRRLNLVRAALQHADASATVQDFARSHGFSELGRFAADYLVAFGEAPSVTLRSRQ